MGYGILFFAGLFIRQRRTRTIVRRHNANYEFFGSLEREVMRMAKNHN
jgi:hypothetical protein